MKIPKYLTYLVTGGAFLLASTDLFAYEHYIMIFNTNSPQLNMQYLNFNPQGLLVDVLNQDSCANGATCILFRIRDDGVDTSGEFSVRIANMSQPNAIYCDYHFYDGNDLPMIQMHSSCSVAEAGQWDPPQGSFYYLGMKFLNQPSPNK